MKNYELLQHGTRDFPLGIHTTVCERGFYLYPHRHKELEFFVMKKGSGVLYIEKEKFVLKEGEGVFINSGRLHVGIKTNEEKAEFFALVFSPEIFASSEKDLIMRKYVTPVIRGEVKFKKYLAREAVEKISEIDKRKSEIKIKSILYDVWDICLMSATREEISPKQSSEIINKTMAYIKENFKEEIKLEELSKRANVSKSYLCRLFAESVHMTPFEFIINTRADKACELLKTTKLSVGEISQMCGFNSFSYFSKVFREKTGFTPSGYRKENI